MINWQYSTLQGIKIPAVYVLDDLTVIFTFTAHNWQNWKKYIPFGHCHEMYRVKAVSVKIPIILKKKCFCEYVKLVAISWKIDILSIA